MGEKINIPPYYQEMMDAEKRSRRPILYNFILAFAVGGALCSLAQLMFNLLVVYGGFVHDYAAGIVLVIIIGLMALATGLGFYDKMAQLAGAGLAVPISGFANSMTAAAIDSRSEGFIQGVAAGSLKLAGAVIVCGSFSAFVVALVVWIGGMFF